MVKNKTIANLTAFSPHLFWDVNKANLDREKDKKYIIHQVLEYGLISDWHLLKKVYDLRTIVKVAKSFRELDKKTLSFIATISEEPIENFRCYNYQQSIPQHWNF